MVEYHSPQRRPSGFDVDKSMGLYFDDFRIKSRTGATCDVRHSGVASSGPFSSVDWR